jgi:hypothetical protein
VYENAFVGGMRRESEGNAAGAFRALHDHVSASEGDVPVA